MTSPDAYLRLIELSDDHIFFALDRLSRQPQRYWAGTDADGNPICKAKRKPLTAATINRYGRNRCGFDMGDKAAFDATWLGKSVQTRRSMRRVQ